MAIPVLAGPDGPTLGPGAAELLDELPDDLFALLETYSASGAAGETVERVVLDTSGLSNPDLRTVLLVGVGAGTTDDLRRAGAALARRSKGRLSVATSLGALCDDAGLRALIEGLVLGSYEFHWRSEGPKERPVQRVVLAGLVDADSRKGVVDRALAVAGAGWRSRTLALVPSNLKSPAWLAEQAADVAQGSGLGIEVWDEKALAKRGLRRHRRGRSRVGQPAAARPARLHAPPPGQEGAARRSRRQGHHLRHRRPVHQAARQHDADEARHDRSRCRPLGDGRARRRELPAPRHRPDAVCGERRRRRLDAARRRVAPLRRTHHAR